MQSFKQKKKMGKNKIKTALFGLGRIGQMHANNLRKNSDFNKLNKLIIFAKKKNQTVACLIEKDTLILRKKFFMNCSL